MGRAETCYALRDGYHIAFQVHGEGSIALLSLDQWPSHCEADWDEAWYVRSLDRVGRVARVVRFDGRGSGLSDPLPPGRAPTLNEWVDDAVAVLDAIGMQRVAVWAGGTSSPFAIRFAARERERVRALVMSNPFARLRVAPDHEYGFSDEVIDGLLEAVRTGWGSGVMLDIYGLSHDDQARLTQARYERLAASPGTALTLAKALCDFDVRDDLAAITAPTLVRVHPNPVLDLQHGRDVAARIPGARVEEAADEWRWMTETDLEATSFASLTEFLGLRYDPHPQRVLATVLFTDIVGSTETAAAMGDQRWHLLLSAHNRAVDRQVSAAGGQIAHSTGDGVLAVFSTPTMALRAAVAIRDELARLSVRFRAGLHAGEIEQTGADVQGLNVHIGARVAALASADEILVSSTVCQAMSGSGVHFTDRGTHPLKGVPDHWHLFALDD